MNKIFGSFPTGRLAIGLLILRLVFGLGIALHGYQKLTNGGAFHWGDQLGIPPFWQSLACLSELCGGLGTTFGLLTPLAALAVTSTMLVAMLKVHIPAHEPYVSMTNGAAYEMCAHYLIYGLVLLFTGPGALSLDSLIFGRHLKQNPYAP